jgi:hypothetical protein
VKRRAATVCQQKADGIQGAGAYFDVSETGQESCFAGNVLVIGLVELAKSPPAAKASCDICSVSAD